jgi:hypothetical protein
MIKRSWRAHTVVFSFSFGLFPLQRQANGGTADKQQYAQAL